MSQVSIARTGSTYPPYIPLSQGEMYRVLMQAEADGFDAAIIGCSADPGLDMDRRSNKPFALKKIRPIYESV
jgi:Asp/Glu/hydantoin racemase